jgi:hypothetical protein
MTTPDPYLPRVPTNGLDPETALGISLVTTVGILLVTGNSVTYSVRVVRKDNQSRAIGDLIEH